MKIVHGPEVVKQAARMICNGATYLETAAELGVNRTTLWRWAKGEPFQKAYDAQLRAILREVEARYEKRMEELEADLDSPNPFAAFRAAKKILDSIPTEEIFG